MKRRMKQSAIAKKVMAFVLTFALILALSPLSAWAYIDDTQTGPVAATQIALGTTATIGTQQTEPAGAGVGNHEFHYLWKKFTVAAASTLTVVLSAPQPNAGMLPNRLCISILQPDAQKTLESTDGNYDVEVKSDSVTGNTKTLYYKVLPGTYYIRAEQWSDSYNGYGTVRVDAAAAPADTEPNDTQLKAQAAKLNTQYKGNIGYFGKLDGESYDQDWCDWYKFTVPKNNYGLKITFARTSDDKELNLQGMLLNSDGYSVGDTISLQKAYSATKNFNIEQAGTYYFKVHGYSMGYGDNTEYTLNIQGVEETTITLTKKKTIDKGKSFKLTAKVKPTTPKRTITWTSSNTSVAKVSTNGTVKGVGVGTATITATVNGVSNVSASCQITVIQPVTKITLNKKSISLKKGKTFALKATIKPRTATIKTIKWSSSNKSIATVTSKGVVKAKKKGTVYITAKSHNGKTVKCKVKVKP